MFKIKILLFLLFFSKAQAETFYMKVSASEACQIASEQVSFKTTISTPEEINFLSGGQARIKPLIAIVDNKSFGSETFTGLESSIQVTSSKGKIYSFTDKGFIRISVTLSKEDLCNSDAFLSFTYSIEDSDGNVFNNLNISIVPTLDNNAKSELLSRKEILTAINTRYLKYFEYYLSDSFLWFNSSNDLTLVDFFSNIDPKYLVSTNAIPSMLSSDLFAVKFIQNRMRLYFGQSSYLEFVAKLNSIEIVNVQLNNKSLRPTLWESRKL